MADTSLNAPSDRTNVRIKESLRWATRYGFKALWHVAPGLAERIVVRFFFTPYRPALSAEEQGWLDRGEPFHIQVHDKRIRGWRWGDGPAVLLVHGWNGRGIRLHRFIAPLMNAGYSAIAFDGPAHGASEGRNTSYFEFTDVVTALFEAELGPEIRGVVAHSFGAAAVVNSLSRRNPAPKTVLLAPVLELKDLVFRAFDRHGVPPEIGERIIGAYEQRFGYSLRDDDPHLRLGGLRSPVLVVHDEEDPVMPYRDSRRISRQFDHLTLHTTHGLGHNRILTDPAVVDAAMIHLGVPGIGVPKKEAPTWTRSNVS
jgi:pimeloyl-ACP methyl ester carboxylesterase